MVALKLRVVKDDKLLKTPYGTFNTSLPMVTVVTLAFRKIFDP